MGQEPPPSTGEPNGDGPSGRPRRDRLQSWQTLLAAVVSATAAIGGILLTKGCDASQRPSPEPTVVDSSEEIRQEAYITKVWSGSDPKLPPPALMVHLEGGFKNLQRGTTVVGLLGPETAAGDEGQRWVVANAVLDRTRDTWKVDLRLRRPAKRILYQVGTASEDLWKDCDAETECLTVARSDAIEGGGGGSADESLPGGADEFTVEGFAPTTPLTDTQTGQTFVSPPAGLG
jgi:hypothetical protein